MSDQQACLICGKELEYLAVPESMECVLCGQPFTSNARCVKGHYICDSCHSGKSLAAAMRVARGISTSDPIEVIDLFMDLPQTHMHGPEHHALVPLALLIAAKNAGMEYDIDAAMAEAIRRGRQVPGGACGFWGSCGAAVGTGIFLSIALGATPVKSEHYGEVSRMTANSLLRIADAGGPRCCKRNSYLCIMQAAEYLEQLTGTRLDVARSIICTHSERNAECIEERCPFHP